MTEIGLRVKRDDGYVETTVTTRLTKIIGKHQIPLHDAVSSGGVWRAPAAANGGLTVDDFTGGEPFFYFLNNGQRSLWGLLLPSVVVGTNSISWTWVDSAVNYHVRAELFNSNTPEVNAVGGVILVYGVYS